MTPVYRKLVQVRDCGFPMEVPPSARFSGDDLVDKVRVEDVVCDEVCFVRRSEQPLTCSCWSPSRTPWTATAAPRRPKRPGPAVRVRAAALAASGRSVSQYGRRAISTAWARCSSSARAGRGLRFGGLRAHHERGAGRRRLADDLRAVPAAALRVRAAGDAPVELDAKDRALPAHHRRSISPLHRRLVSATAPPFGVGALEITFQPPAGGVNFIDQYNVSAGAVGASADLRR